MKYIRLIHYALASSLVTGLHIASQGDNADGAFDIHCGSEPSFQMRNMSAIPRIALLLRGEAFRQGKQGRYSLTPAAAFRTQQNVYRSHLKIIELLQSRGYQTDVITATYSTPYDRTLESMFGQTLKQFVKLEPEGSSQHTNVWANVLALEKYARNERIWYDFIIMARHDVYLTEELVNDLWLGTDSAKKVWLVNKLKPGSWCSGVVHEQSGWNATSWMSLDFLQIIPSRLWGCVRSMFFAHLPNCWPYEAWEQLVPFVHGMSNIGFLSSDSRPQLYTLCRDRQFGFIERCLGR